jgi:nitrate reductase NapE component
MFFIPGFIISILTFPGVIIHETAHHLFCRLTKLAIFDVCYFRVGNPAGYVIHEPTQNFYKAFLVSMGPFFLNTILCVVFCSAAFLPVWELGVNDPLAYFFYWFGISIGMHAFPSTQDLSNVWHLMPAEAKRFNVLAIVSYPIVAVVFVLNLARVVWADLGYGIVVGILVPLAIFRAIT